MAYPLGPEEVQAVARLTGLPMTPERARDLAPALQALLERSRDLLALDLEGVEPLYLAPLT